jgi:hypothetical protein
LRFLRKETYPNTKVHDYAESADVEVGISSPEELARIIDECGYTQQQLFYVDEIAFCWEKMPYRTFIAREDKSVPGFKVSKDRG